MRVGIIGAKTIGGTLGRKLSAAGHEVVFGVRNQQNPDLAPLLAECQGRASVASVAEAIASGEVVIFAIPGHAMEATIAEHAEALADKAVIDAANRGGAPQMNSLAAFTAHAPTAQLFRAFNSLGWENFADPYFGTEQADLFFSGPAGTDQALVEQVIAAVGLRPIWVGGPEQTEVVDNLARLWFALALGQKRGRHLAFKLLSDEAKATS